ncbi:MAG: 50S ribosomal protein L18e [Candidatus Aenigmarchaeota archaeon]|nr:50S ribosomal protein L18e [Candidatus Aenigmarchaeota archaeon]
MKARDKNEPLKAEIAGLHAKGLKQPLLKSVARGLNRPRSVRHEVNIHSISKFAREGEAVAVPGIVLGSGEISKPVNVYALRFSGSAREKIEKAGGKCMPIGELEGSKGKVRILG